MTPRPRVRDYMATDLTLLQPEMEILHAMEVLLEKRISGAPVVKPDGVIVGVLSKKDCLRAALNAIYTNTGVGLVRDHMTASNLVVAHPDEDIVDVAQDMLQKNKRRRPVVEDGKLIGQITCRQLLTAVKQFSN